MTAGNGKFILDFGWQVLLKDLGLSAQDLLRQARLPLDLLNRKAPALTTEEYFRLWEGMTKLFDNPAFPLRLGQAFSVEAFSPPIFACFCSADLNVALTRLSQYKPLIGPLTLDVVRTDRQTSVTLGGLPKDKPLPTSLVATELVFLVYMARLATRERIGPTTVQLSRPLPEAEQYAAFFGTDVTEGPVDGERGHAVGLRTRTENPYGRFGPGGRLSRARPCLFDGVSGERRLRDGVGGQAAGGQHAHPAATPGR